MIASRASGRRDGAVIAAGLAALLAAAGINLAHGEMTLALSDVLAALAGTGDPLLRDVVADFRLPRVVMGVLAGVALAASGALMQSVLRNPLASPGVLGITTGSYLFIVLATVFAPALLDTAPLLLTVAGGWLTVLLVYLVAGGPRATPLRIVLAGLIVSMTLGGVTSAVLVLNEAEARHLMSWSAGLLRQNGWGGAQFAAPWVLASFLVIWATARRLDLAMLGDDAARTLGLRTRLLFAMTLVGVLIMTGAVVAVTGPIGFVGLVAPHLVKLAGVRRHAALLPASALWGAALLLCADTLTHLAGSLLSAPPVGSVMALLGAPWLLWLVLRAGHGRGAGLAAAAPFGLGRGLGLSPQAVALVLAGMLIALVVAGCTLSGGVQLSVPQVIRALFQEGDALAGRVIWELRLPRMLAALLAGAALAVAGALIQGALRNPLADSAMIGVNGGATAGVLLLLAATPVTSGPWVSLAALAGGFLAAAAVYGLAWRQRLAPAVVILVGIGVAALCGAVVQILVMGSRYTDSPLVWLIGSLYMRGWPSVSVLAATLAVFFPAAWLLGRRMEMLAFDDVTAGSAGLDIPKTRLAAGITGVVFAAAAVSQVGPVGYVGLLAPHAARLMIGHRFRPLLTLAALIGAFLLGAADILARLVIAPAELPAGAVIALIGAPYLIYLVHRSGRK